MVFVFSVDMVGSLCFCVVGVVWASLILTLRLLIFSGSLRVKGSGGSLWGWELWFFWFGFSQAA